MRCYESQFENGQNTSNTYFLIQVETSFVVHNFKLWFLRKVSTDFYVCFYDRLLSVMQSCIIWQWPPYPRVNIKLLTLYINNIAIDKTLSIKKVFISQQLSYLFQDLLFYFYKQTKTHREKNLLSTALFLVIYKSLSPLQMVC